MPNPTLPGAPRVLSLIPPMTQLNTPYPSTAYLTGFLRGRGVHAVQDDLALALALRLLSPGGLADLKRQIDAVPQGERTVRVHAFAEAYARYAGTIALTIRFL